MKFCSFENYFTDYVSGELDNKEILEFQSHLENCPTCKNQLDEFYEIHYSIKSRKRIEPQPEIVEKYQDIIYQKICISKWKGR